MKRKLAVLFSTLFGVGYIPFAPGTFGTAVTAIGYYLFMRRYSFEIPDYLLNIYILITAAILFILGVISSSEAEKSLGHDSGKIVIDEVVGYLISIIFLPSVVVGRLWLVVIYSFVLFRVFDIGKPWPISKSQSLKSGWGIMIDDVIAGIFANILAQIIIRIYPNFFGIY